MTKYFSPFADGGYLPGQVKGNVSLVSPGSNTGWETGAALTHVTRDGHSAGAEVRGGTMTYDTTVSLGSVSIANGFVGVRPKVGCRLSDATELTDRSDLSGRQVAACSHGATLNAQAIRWNGLIACDLHLRQSERSRGPASLAELDSSLRGGSPRAMP